MNKILQMKNLNYITCVELDEFNLIKFSKNLLDRSRLNRISSTVTADYQDYLNNFDTIQSSVPSTYKNGQSKALRNCYSSNTQALANLKDRIYKAQTVEFQNTCPYCLLGTISTIDHYIPQGEYPSYSVLAKNMIPCCSTCNSTKNVSWRASGERIFIHFYNDNILTVQFLFGILSFSGSLPSIRFSLRHSPGITNAEYLLIQNHFRILHLISNYNLSMSKIISDIKVDVEALRNTFAVLPTQNEIQRFLLSKSAKLKIIYGVNYWKAISIDLLANSNTFLISL